MSELNPATEGQLTDENKSIKTNALIAYALMVVGLFTGIFWVVGGIWAMIKKGESKNSVYAGHFGNLVSVFWWSLLFTIIGIATSFLIVGYPILLVTWVWSISRIIKGIARILSDKPY